MDHLVLDLSPIGSSRRAGRSSRRRGSRYGALPQTPKTIIESVSCFYYSKTRLSAERSEPMKSGASAVRNAPSEARVAEARSAEPVGGASRRARPRQFCRGLASLNLPRFRPGDPLPSAGQEGRCGAGICRAQTACLIAAAYKKCRGAVPVRGKTALRGSF